MERRTRIIFMGTASALGLLILFACAHALYTTFKPTSFTVTFDHTLSNTARTKIHGILKGTITHVPIQELYARIARRVPAAKGVTLYYRGVRHVHAKIQAYQPCFILEGDVPHHTFHAVLTQDQTIAPTTNYAPWAISDLPTIALEKKPKNHSHQKPLKTSILFYTPSKNNDQTFSKHTGSPGTTKQPSICKLKNQILVRYEHFMQQYLIPSYALRYKKYPVPGQHKQMRG
jgi:hypothetical protein